MKEAIIIGYSGHSFVVLDILQANQYVVKGYCENSEKHLNPYNLKYLGSEDDLEDLDTDKYFFIGIGDNLTRRKIFNRLSERNVQMPAIFHPMSAISATVKVNLASVIMPGSIINSFSVLGKGVICNSACVIEHECVIGDFAHIAPGAVLAGGVKVGDNSFIGANSVVKQGVNIGSNVVVGAGSVILKDIEDNNIVYGNPSKPRLL